MTKYTKISSTEAELLFILMKKKALMSLRQAKALYKLLNLLGFFQGRKFKLVKQMREYSERTSKTLLLRFMLIL